MQCSLNAQKVNPGRVEVNLCKHTMNSSDVLIPLVCAIKMFEIWPLVHKKTLPIPSLMIFTFIFFT